MRSLKCAVYVKPNSRKKTATIDHISYVYNHLGVKYPKGLYWIIASDTNDLKLDMILNLSPNFKKLVTKYTRLNPPRIIDPIVTDLGKFYQAPIVLPPLDNDPDKNGKPSDHKIIKMKPISNVNNKPARTKCEVTFRPFPDNGIAKLGDWFKTHDWINVTSAVSANEKSAILQNTCMEALNKYLPTKNNFIH